MDFVHARPYIGLSRTTIGVLGLPYGLFGGKVICLLE